MVKTDVIDELKKLSTTERLAIIEDMIHITREEIEKQKHDSQKRKQELEAAARTLLPDYNNDKELTSFTALDSEEFYE